MFGENKIIIFKIINYRNKYLIMFFILIFAEFLYFFIFYNFANLYVSINEENFSKNFKFFVVFLFQFYLTLKINKR